MGEVVIENYEDSVVYFTKMSQSIFGDLFKEDDPITLEKVINKTDFGGGGPTVVGTPRLCVFWFQCEDCELLNAN